MHMQSMQTKQKPVGSNQEPSCSKATVIINESPMCLVCDAKCFMSPNYTVYKP